MSLYDDIILISKITPYMNLYMNTDQYTKFLRMKAFVKNLMKDPYWRYVIKRELALARINEKRERILYKIIKEQNKYI